MILYHGSNTEFDKIDLALSRPYKDFGQGFYLSANKEQANQMAQQKTLQLGGSPVVMAYELDEHLLASTHLNIKRFDNYCEEWATFILTNRNRQANGRQHNYDVVIGPIANDKVGVQLFRYIKEYIDLPTLVQKLQYLELTVQYYFGTERAVKLLKRL